MTKYATLPKRHRHPLRRLLIVAVVLLVPLIVAAAFIRHSYDDNLKPVSNNQTIKLITIKDGASSNQIAEQLYSAGLIRSTWAFEWYVRIQEGRSDLQAGTYALRASESLPDIVKQLTQGKVATKLVTILPGQRLDQIKQALINAGFSPSDVATALNPNSYSGNTALVDKPASASLEGYLYPDSFQKASDTSAVSIVQESLAEMSEQLTPALRSAFATEGLSTYQGIVLASIVGQEVSNPGDQAQVAQVFLTRLRSNMNLGSDVTAFYGAILAGQPPSVNYDSPYNTRLHPGLPPTPISNVNTQDLNATAHPASTNWLFFVAGDNGKTYFSQTQQQQDANVAQYCHKLCSQN